MQLTKRVFPGATRARVHGTNWTCLVQTLSIISQLREVDLVEELLLEVGAVVVSHQDRSG